MSRLIRINQASQSRLIFDISGASACIVGFVIYLLIRKASRLFPPLIILLLDPDRSVCEFCDEKIGHSVRNGFRAVWRHCGVLVFSSLMNSTRLECDVKRACGI